MAKTANTNKKQNKTGIKKGNNGSVLHQRNAPQKNRRYWYRKRGMESLKQKRQQTQDKKSRSRCPKSNKNMN